MKRYFCFALTFIMMAVSCTKGTPSDSIYPFDNRIHLNVLNLTGIDVHTKAVVPVEDLDSFYAAASTGTAGSETLGFSSATFADPDGDGKYSGTPVWPNEPTDFNFYASNLPLTFTSGGMTVSATNGTDVVCAYSPDWAYKTECDMTFYHILARLGNVTTMAVDDYTVSGISISITPKTGGTYNILTGNGRTDGTGWSSVTTASSASSVANSSVGTKGNDIYLVPGAYLMSVSWTATKGDYSHSFGPADVLVPMTAGKVNDVVFRIGGEADEILFSVSVSDWGVNPVDKGTLEAVHDPEPSAASFGGLLIASGNLYYNGSSWSIDDKWNSHNTYGSSAGVNSGVESTYFNFLQMGALFEKAGFTYSDGNIDNLLDPFDGWRLPTPAEWKIFVTTSTATRTGSTVNGSLNKHYALIQLTGVTYAGSTTPIGVLLFPDDQTISGKTLSGMDNNTLTTGVTESELQFYLGQGCAFLPGTGRNAGSFYEGGTAGYYWTSQSAGGSAYNIYFNNSNPGSGEATISGTRSFSIRLVRSID
jgi:hypothetical protein